MCGEANRTLNLKTYVPYVPTRDERRAGRRSLIWFIRHQPPGGSGEDRHPGRSTHGKGAGRTLH